MVSNYTQLETNTHLEKEPVPIPRERKTKLHENISANTSSNDDTISSCGTKTVIIEKADVHRSAPPIPLPRKKIQSNTKIISDSDEKPDGINVIQTIPTITEVRSISSVQTDITDSHKDTGDVEFLKKESQTFLVKSYPKENDKQYEVDLKSSENKKEADHNVIFINEKKQKREKLPILVEKISTDTDETSYESSDLDKSKTDESTVHDDALKTKTKSKLIGKLKVQKSKENSSNSNTNNFDYDYVEIIGIYIHETSELKFDRLISGPMIRMSMFNAKNGKLLCKSDPSRNVVLNLEPINVEFIQPIISKRCNFKEEK